MRYNKLLDKVINANIGSYVALYMLCRRKLSEREALEMGHKMTHRVEHEVTCYCRECRMRNGINKSARSVG